MEILPVWEKPCEKPEAYLWDVSVASVGKGCKPGFAEASERLVVPKAKQFKI